MKKLLMVIPLVFLLCFTFACQDKEAMAELEEFRAQAALEEQNVELVRKAFEAFGKGDMEAFGELVAPDYVYYGPSSTYSLEELKESAKVWWASFPDMSFSMEEIFAVEDKVVFMLMQRGTHTGDFMGIPATGNKFEFSGILITRIADGKIIWEKDESDYLGFYQQLGMEFKPKEGKK
jgi:steroid delta-isomerase-like uncharacterized protein